MRLAEPPRVELYKLFISSSDEPSARRLRRRVKMLMEDVICPSVQNDYPASGVTFFVDMWERTAAQKADGDPNAQFVKRARESSLTLVLIIDELRPGTKEELEAVVAEPGVEVSLLSFEPSRNADPQRRRKVERALKKHKKSLFYKRVGRPDSDDAWFEISRQLMAFVFSAMRDSDERWRNIAPIEVR